MLVGEFSRPEIVDYRHPKQVDEPNAVQQQLCLINLAKKWALDGKY